MSRIKLKKEEMESQVCLDLFPRGHITLNLGNTL